MPWTQGQAGSSAWLGLPRRRQMPALPGCHSACRLMPNPGILCFCRLLLWSAPFLRHSQQRVLAATSAAMPAGLVLHTASAASGQRVTILLEELGLPYELKKASCLRHAGRSRGQHCTDCAHAAVLAVAVAPGPRGGPPRCTPCAGQAAGGGAPDPPVQRGAQPRGAHPCAGCGGPVACLWLAASATRMHSQVPHADPAPSGASACGRAGRRVPARLLPHAVDHDQGGLRVFESGAIMMYLLECKAPTAGGAAADLARELLPPPSDAARRAAVLTWLFWMHVRGHMAFGCGRAGPLLVAHLAVCRDAGSCPRAAPAGLSAARAPSWEACSAYGSRAAMCHSLQLARSPRPGKPAFPHPCRAPTTLPRAASLRRCWAARPRPPSRSVMRGRRWPTSCACWRTVCKARVRCGTGMRRFSNAQIGNLPRCTKQTSPDACGAGPRGDEGLNGMPCVGVDIQRRDA